MDSMCALCLRASGPQGAGKARRQNEGLTEIVQSGLKTVTKPARHSASCRVLIFIVEKSVVMVYYKLLNFCGRDGRLQRFVV